LRQTDVLQSHTVETAAQEIAAIILVTALLARERARAANGQIPVLRIKFGVMLAIVRSMWFCLGPIEDLLTEQQKVQVVANAKFRDIADSRVPKTKQSCSTRSTHIFARS
jgi:hypothetical protein